MEKLIETEKTPLISIIVPIYRMEKYIRQCRKCRRSRRPGARLPETDIYIFLMLPYPPVYYGSQQWVGDYFQQIPAAAVECR